MELSPSCRFWRVPLLLIISSRSEPAPPSGTFRDVYVCIIHAYHYWKNVKTRTVARRQKHDGTGGENGSHGTIVLPSACPKTRVHPCRFLPGRPWENEFAWPSCCGRGVRLIRSLTHRHLFTKSCSSINLLTPSRSICVGNLSL